MKKCFVNKAESGKRREEGGGGEAKDRAREGQRGHAVEAERR